MSAGEAGLAEANEQITQPLDTSGGESALNIDVWSAFLGFVISEASPHTPNQATQWCIKQVLVMFEKLHPGRKKQVFASVWC